MGQYQQWLLLREADQRLQAQLRQLEAELAQLQERAHLLEQSFCPADNLIIRVLTANLNGHALAASRESTENRASGNASSTNRASDEAGQSEESAESVASALFAWGGLPNFAPHDIQQSLPQVDELLPPLAHPETVLLPEDMKPFFDEYGQTDPQLEIPWWLRSILSSADADHPTGPIDPERIRTNRLVQRWLERWKKLPTTPQKSEEG
jgi:hypothetical protein